MGSKGFGVVVDLKCKNIVCWEMRYFQTPLIPTQKKASFHPNSMVIKDISSKAMLPFLFVIVLLLRS